MKAAPARDYLLLDSLSAAYAAVGQFDNATSTAKQAIEAAPPEFAEAIKQRLAMFEQGQPYIDNPPVRLPADSNLEFNSPVARPSPKSR